MPCRPSCLTTDRPHPARSRPPGNPSTPPHEPLKDACQLTEIRFRLDMQDEVEEWLIDLSSMMLTILLRYLAITSSRLSGLRGSPLACVTAASSLRPSARVTSTRAGHAAGCSWPKLLLLRRTRGSIRAGSRRWPVGWVWLMRRCDDRAMPPNSSASTGCAVRLSASCAQRHRRGSH